MLLEIMFAICALVLQDISVEFIDHHQVHGLFPEALVANTMTLLHSILRNERTGFLNLSPSTLT